MNRRAAAGAILLMASACIRISGQFARIAARSAPEERHPAIVTEYDERRLKGLEGAFQSGEVIGYVTNDPDSPEAIRSYYLTQYVLAPAVIVRGEANARVIVDDRPGCAAPIQEPQGRLLRDAGNGVRLIGREER